MTFVIDKYHISLFKNLQEDGLKSNIPDFPITVIIYWQGIVLMGCF